MKAFADSNQMLRSKSFARWAAIIFGTLAGIVSVAAGGRSLLAARQWREVIGALLGMMMLLPLTMVGIFKPRGAAYGMFASAFIYLAAFVFFAPQSDYRGTTFLGNAKVLLTLVAPGCVVAGLLLYSSGMGTRSSTATNQNSAVAAVTEKTTDFGALNERRRLAHWAAVLFGLISGALEWPWGRHSVLMAAGRGDWMSATGMAAASLTLLPLSILAVFKPRIAAYGVVANLVLVWAYLIFLSLAPPFTRTETVARILFSLYVSAPFVAVAALLFYASGHRGRSKEGRSKGTA